MRLRPRFIVGLLVNLDWYLGSLTVSNKFLSLPALRLQMYLNA